MPEETANADVMVMVQGQSSKGDSVDRVMNGDYVLAFILHPDSIEQIQFGAMSALDAANMIVSLKKTIEVIKTNYPTVGILDSLFGLENHNKLMSYITNLEEEDDENAE